MLFISHTAEEMGLVGSAWYTDHPTVPRDSIVAEIDLDMVGRGDAADIAGGGPGYLEVVGARRRSTELGMITDSIAAAMRPPFVINYAVDAPGHPDQDYCRADHFSYARYGIPALNMSRGDHVDYHQVTDETQYIDFDALARVATFAELIAVTVADRDHRLVRDRPAPDPHAPCVQ
jgi:Zn-dependent M28 family amino/carboxypeptidase